ncbi:MAG: hypothetical protein ACXWK1_03145 [Caulobacteraceae bacterium]
MARPSGRLGRTVGRRSGLHGRRRRLLSQGGEEGVGRRGLGRNGGCVLILGGVLVRARALADCRLGWRGVVGGPSGEAGGGQGLGREGLGRQRHRRGRDGLGGLARRLLVRRCAREGGGGRVRLRGQQGGETAGDPIAGRAGRGVGAVGLGPRLRTAWTQDPKNVRRQAARAEQARDPQTSALTADALAGRAGGRSPSGLGLGVRGQGRSGDLHLCPFGRAEAAHAAQGRSASSKQCLRQFD